MPHLECNIWGAATVAASRCACTCLGTGPRLDFLGLGDKATKKTPVQRASAYAIAIVCAIVCARVRLCDQYMYVIMYACVCVRVCSVSAQAKLTVV